VSKLHFAPCLEASNVNLNISGLMVLENFLRFHNLNIKMGDYCGPTLHQGGMLLTIMVLFYVSKPPFKFDLFWQSCSEKDIL
jgi:hypothetical protein